mgnify:CR=1 FL=1
MKSDKNEDVILLASKGGNDSVLFLLDKIHAIQEELENSINEIKDKFNNTVKEIKENTPDLNKVLESVKGKDGELPTDEYLLSLIRPLIPEPIKGEDGHTPTEQEILTLIKPFIPKDGKTPTKEELIDLIKPLIPEPRNGKDGASDTAEQIRNKLEILKGKERLDISAIDGLEEKIKAIPERPTTTIFGFRQARYVKFSFAGDGSTTAFTLPHEPIGKGLALWAYYNGQWLQPAIHFNIVKLTFTTTFTPENGTTIEGFLQTQ